MPPKALAFLGGKVIPLAEAKVGVMTHALHYGTAAFEGIRGNWNEEQGKVFVFRMREHYDRLLRSGKILHMSLPYTAEQMCKITVGLLEQCGYRQDVYIRPLAFKSQELVANLKLHEIKDDLCVIVVPFGSYIANDRPLRCQTSSWRRPEDAMMPTGVKIAGLYTTSILAKTEAIKAGYDEAVLLNWDGTVSEGSGENLFMVRDGVISTPTETDNCLLGITRDSTITIAREVFGWEVVQRRIHRSELYLADEVFLTGTAAHLTPVGELDHRPIGTGLPGPVTQKLQGEYFKAIQGRQPKYLKWCTAVVPGGG